MPEAWCVGNEEFRSCVILNGGIRFSSCAKPTRLLRADNVIGYLPVLWDDGDRVILLYNGPRGFSIKLKQQSLIIPLPINGSIILDDGYTVAIWLSASPPPPTIIKFFEFNLRDSEENMLRFFQDLYGDALEPINLANIRYPFETQYYRVWKNEGRHGKSIVFEVKV